MLELAGQIRAARARGRAVAVATVVGIAGSAPRGVGATMFVDESGAVVGSVSGGCVESAVVEVCNAVLAGARPTVVRFGISDDMAMGVGLTCGGDLDVFVQRLCATNRAGGAEPETGSDTTEAGEAEAGRIAGIATVVAGPDALLGRSVGCHARPGDLTDAILTDAGLAALSVARLEAELAARVRSGRSGLVSLACGEGSAGTELSLPSTTQFGTEPHTEPRIDVFFDVSLPPARLLIFGALDFSAALADAAKLLGYRVTLCDARALFTTPERFPSADEVVVSWPDAYLANTQVDERTVICVLTHDPKFDIPLLQVALGLPVAYVGAMGSRRTHDERMRLLADAGVTDAELARLHSPIGLDIGAGTPEETAISILAEVIAARTGASGSELRSLDGPIHRRSSAPSAGAPSAIDPVRATTPQSVG